LTLHAATLLIVYWLVKIKESREMVQMKEAPKETAHRKHAARPRVSAWLFHFKVCTASYILSFILIQVKKDVA